MRYTTVKDALVKKLNKKIIIHNKNLLQNDKLTDKINFEIKNV